MLGRAEGGVTFSRDRAGRSGIPVFQQRMMSGCWVSEEANSQVPNRAEQLLSSPSGTPVPRRVTRAPQVSGCDLNISD